MKKILILCVIVFSVQQNIWAQKKRHNSNDNKQTMKENIYQFKVEDIEGNTASKCGLTPQYKDLQALYDKYKDQNFVIVGFPANNFASQEPGNNEEIATFCERNYGVTFPMMSKISVKGDDMHPLYLYLTQKDKNGVEDSEVSWNFQKYLINENGEVEKVISPKTLPTDASVVNWIENKG